MKSKFLSLLLSGVFVLTCFAFSSTTLMAKKRIVFGGGPAGGTFQVVANGVQVYKPVKALKDYTIKAQSSAGSIENLRKVDRNRSQLGVVYSGHRQTRMSVNGTLPTCWAARIPFWRFPAWDFVVSQIFDMPSR